MIRVVQDLTREELDELKQSYICVMKEGSDEPAYWDDLAEAPEYISDKRCLNIMTEWYLQKKIFLIIKISLK